MPKFQIRQIAKGGNICLQYGTSSINHSSQLSFTMEHARLQAFHQRLNFKFARLQTEETFGYNTKHTQQRSHTKIRKVPTTLP